MGKPVKHFDLITLLPQKYLQKIVFGDVLNLNQYYTQTEYEVRFHASIKIWNLKEGRYSSWWDYCQGRSPQLLGGTLITYELGKMAHLIDEFPTTQDIEHLIKTAHTGILRQELVTLPLLFQRSQLMLDIFQVSYIFQ